MTSVLLFCYSCFQSCTIASCILSLCTSIQHVSRRLLLPSPSDPLSFRNFSVKYLICISGTSFSQPPSSCSSFTSEIQNGRRGSYNSQNNKMQRWMVMANISTVKACFEDGSMLSERDMACNPSRWLVLVAVLDAAENVALNFHLFGALDESLLALPVNRVDVFLHLH